MNKISPSTVEQRIQNGYNFDLGKYISEGFTIFSKEWLLFSLYGFVAFLIMMGSFLTFLGGVLLMYPVMLGFSLGFEKVVRGQKLNFSDFFGGFKNFGQHFILGIITVFVFLFLYALLFLIMGWPRIVGLADDLMLVLKMFAYYLFLYAAIFAFQVCIIFAPFLIHYGGYSALEAIQKSFQLAKKKFGWLLLFVFLVGILSSVGYLICFIGTFASMAWGLLIQFSMVRDVLMGEEYSEIDEIGLN